MPALATAIAVLAFTLSARADLLIQIDKAAQRMIVSLDGEQLYVWPVSTGIQRYDTPNGAFSPFRMERDHYSREWDNAPMPYSIFFTKKGHAIHGTNHRSLGQPASHGCVRLSVRNAAILWDLVQQQKITHTMVVLTGRIPAAGEVVVARRGRDAEFDNIADDEEFTYAPPPQRQRIVRDGWREYNDGPRYYYYRARPYYPPRRYYRYGGAPYFFPFGR